MNRKPHELAGETVKIRADVHALGGKDFRIEDWWINVAGGSWMFADGNPAAMRYGIRAGLAGLPVDDEVLYGKVNGLGYLVHVSEFEAAS
jgi:hypothetical protein